jgi:hypothetical protein
MTSFDVQGDEGAPNVTITNGNVLQIIGGTNGIDTEDGDAGADTLTINHDATEVASDTWTDAQVQDIALGTGTSGNYMTDVTLGAGIGGSHTPAEGSTATITTASGETDFLASGALTCGASTQGQVQVHTTPLQYCDNAATPTLQYAAYGNSSGESTAAGNDSVALTTDTTGNYAAGDAEAGAALTGDNAASFFAAGELEVARGGTGAASLTDGGILLGAGTGAVTALGVATNGQIPIGDGATDPVLAVPLGTVNEIEVTTGAGSLQFGIVTSPTLDGTNFTGIVTGGITNGTIDALDMNTDARSDTCFAVQIPAPVDADEWEFELPDWPGTMDDVRCEIQGATNAVIKLCDGEDFGDDTCTTDILSPSTLTCDATGANDSSLSNNTFVANDTVTLLIDSISGTPSWLRVKMNCTRD